MKRLDVKNVEAPSCKTTGSPLPTDDNCKGSSNEYKGNDENYAEIEQVKLNKSDDVQQFASASIRKKIYAKTEDAGIVLKQQSPAERNDKKFKHKNSAKRKSKQKRKTTKSMQAKDGDDPAQCIQSSPENNFIPEALHSQKKVSVATPAIQQRKHENVVQKLKKHSKTFNENSAFKEMQDLILNLKEIASTTTDTKKLLCAFSKACDFANKNLSPSQRLVPFEICAELTFEFFMSLKFSNLPSQKWCKAVIKSIKSLRNAAINLIDADKSSCMKVYITLSLCLCAFLYSVKWYADSRESFEETLNPCQEILSNKEEITELYKKTLILLKWQFEAIEQKLAGSFENWSKESEFKSSISSNNSVPVLHDDNDTEPTSSTKLLKKNEDLAEVMEKLEITKDNSGISKQTEDSHAEVPSPPDASVITKQLLESSLRTCYDAIENLSSSEKLKTFQQCSTIIYNHCAVLYFDTTPTNECCEFIADKINIIKSEAENLANVDKRDCMEICVRLLLSSCSFQYSAGRREECKETVEAALLLLHKYFGKKVKKMRLYGRARFHMARSCLTVGPAKSTCDTSLKESFDVFYAINVSKPDNGSIADLYSLALFIGPQRRLMMKQKLIRHVYTKILARSEASLSQFELLLNTITIILFSELLGNKKEKLCKYLGVLSQSDLETPQTELLSTVSSAVMYLITFNVLSTVPAFEKKVFSYGKDLCLLSTTAYEKFLQFNVLSWVVVLGNKYLSNFRFYVGILDDYLAELQKETLVSDCTWMHEKLSNAHLFLSCAFIGIADFDRSLYHANEAFRTTIAYDGESYEYIEFNKAMACYISGFSLHGKGNFHLSKVCFENQLLILENLPPKYYDRVEIARSHLKYVNSLLFSNEHLLEVPDGLIKLLPINPF